MRNDRKPLENVKTGIGSLDRILGGGIPKGSMIVLAGPPGSGKTIMAQQIGFHQADMGQKVLFIQTLSEPTVKTLLYLNQFDFFNKEYLENRTQFIDLGVILKTKGLEAAIDLIMEHVQKEKPSLVVIDSFRVFSDLAESAESLRKFSYQIAVNMAAWECTTLLLGEFNQSDIETNPLFSVVDGLVRLSQEEVSGENQRMLQVVKVRGTHHNRDKHPFRITDAGIEVFAARTVLRPDPNADRQSLAGERVRTGIKVLDELLGQGLSRGSSTVVSGDAGTGKTMLMLEFVFRGAAEFGQKGLFVSFEETEERLCATAANMGWDLRAMIAKGLVEIFFIPMADILIEANLLEIHQRMLERKFVRLAIDSLSAFLHKVGLPVLGREKLSQISTIVQNSQAVALLASSRQSDSIMSEISGVKESIADGLIFLYLEDVGSQRQRKLEVYKLRNTSHILGRHRFSIQKGGLMEMPP